MGHFEGFNFCVPIHSVACAFSPKMSAEPCMRCGTDLNIFAVMIRGRVQVPKTVQCFEETSLYGTRPHTVKPQYFIAYTAVQYSGSMIEQNIQIHNIQTFPDSSDQRVGESTRLSNMCAPPLSHPVCATCRQAQFPYTIHRNVVASRGNRVLTILHVWHGFWQLLHRFFLSIYMIEISLDQRCQFTHSHHIKKKK